MARDLTTVRNAHTHTSFGYQDGQVYLNLAAPVVLTANLPLAGADMDGRIIIEDGGTGDRNLIVYAGGQRFRVDGGSNV